MRLHLPILRHQRPRGPPSPAPDRRDQRARGRVRRPVRRRDPRADRVDQGRRSTRSRRARSRPTTSSTTPTPSAAATSQGAPQARERALQGALDDVIPEVFAAAREASKRTLGMRHFDVQLDRRRRPPPGEDRRDEDGRGQDPRPDAGPDAQRPDRPRRAPRHRQRLPRPARRAVDGAGLPLPRAVGRASSPTTRATCSSPASRRPTSG